MQLDGLPGASLRAAFNARVYEEDMANPLLLDGLPGASLRAAYNARVYERDMDQASERRASRRPRVLDQGAPSKNM
jgi:hypothetical protein